MSSQTASVQKKTLSDYTFVLVQILFLGTFVFAILYPLLYIVSASFSDPFQLLVGNVTFYPVKPTLAMYKRVFDNNEIWRSYVNTIVYTGVGTLISLILTASAAYPLSRPQLYKGRIFTVFFLFTMFFQGGMIPTYLLVTRTLDIDNTIWSIVLPSAVSTYNMIVMRTFFANTIPEELLESAALDGYNDIQSFFAIVIPLSKAILAIMALFYGVSHWNSWFNALLYLRDRSLYPLQMVLREILVQNDTSSMTGAMNISDQEMVGAGIKYATMVVSTVPIMLLYPFLQKYFVQGVMIGAVKG